jgi:iduronate 2-sulfatase
MKFRKNILFIAVDDLRPEISCFGKTKLHTPNIDKLASMGMQFDRAYCQVPVSMPSRASMMSGVRPNKEWRDRIFQFCPNGEPSLPGHLKKNGYNTISVGKVYHYNDDDESSWTRRYTDTFYEEKGTGHGYCSGYQIKENVEKMLARKSKETAKIEYPPISECVDAPDSSYPDGVIANRTIEVLNELGKEDAPLFLATGFYRPHLPWAVPKKYWDLYEREDVDLADNQFFPKDGIGKSGLCDFVHYDDEIRSTYSDLGEYKDDDFPILNEAKQRECIHAYWASVSFMDAQVGKILDELERLDMMKDTIIVLWGDNGWHLGEHKLWSKFTSFDESTRIPMIISNTGADEHGRTDALVELVDIYPTLCDLIDLEIPAHLEGESLQPLLKDKTRKGKKGIFSRIADADTICTERYRFTYYEGATPEGDQSHLPNTGKCELFDLLNDPRENVNVAKQPEYKEVVEEMTEKLSAGWTAMRMDNSTLQ